MEKSVVFAKPGHILVANLMFSYLELKLDGDFERIANPPVFVHPIPREIIEEHYKHIRKYSTFNTTIEAYLREGLVLTAYRGPNIISRIREIVGNTDPANAGPETIRGKFGRGSLKIALETSSYLENAIHASGSVIESDTEFRIWTPFLKF